ncbi:MAG: TldD/PmbA family protein [Proteobacteria bacterium]|nr:TldD/PmbA family protein [Pseudomonadota bacterium]
MARDVIALALRRAKSAGADQADAMLVEADSLESRVRGDEIDFVVQSQERTLGIRALIRGSDGRRSAVTSTSDLSEAAVERMADETVAIARATAEDPFAGLPDGGFASSDPLPDLDLFDPGDRNVAVEARIEDARRAEQAARSVDERIQNSEGSQAASHFSRVAYGNSEGFLGEYESASHSLFSEPLAHENGSMQRDYWMTVGRRLSALEDPAAVGRRAAERALRRLGARRVPTCEVPVIFDAVTAPSLLRQVAGCLSGYAIYRSMSFLAERMGERIGSELLTLVDDGRLPGGLGSKPFDGEGLPTRRNVLIERGELCTWLLDSYSARKLGGTSTGNASRGPGGAPGVGATNLWLEPGEGTLEEIVADTPRGLLVTELIGMGFNPVTGDYSRGAAGLWIEDGKIAHPVEEVTVAGNLADMLTSIDAVGEELHWLGRVASPPLRVARMTVAGE